MQQLTIPHLKFMLLALIAKFDWALKTEQSTDKLAYFLSSSVMKKKSFTILIPFAKYDRTISSASATKFVDLIHYFI
jgi:hypothetical protein